MPRIRLHDVRHSVAVHLTTYVPRTEVGAQTAVTRRAGVRPITPKTRTLLNEALADLQVEIEDLYDSGDPARIQEINERLCHLIAYTAHLTGKPIPTPPGWPGVTLPWPLARSATVSQPWRTPQPYKVVRREQP